MDKPKPANDLPSINIEELLRTLNRKGIPVQSEIGAFIALEACDAIAERSIKVTSRDVWIDQQGEVSVKAGQLRSSSEDAAGSVIDLLSDLLVASAHGVSPMLLELIEERPEHDRLTLSQVRDHLEASLVPLNRSASKRVLARILREAFREGDRPSVRPTAAPTLSELDEQFDELFGEAELSAKKPEDGTDS